MSETITPKMVKELRERTGVGMGKCKDALVKAGGNMNEAIDILRKAGMASAVKKEGRETKEGMIGHAETDKAYAVVEINAETDFVIKNDSFQEFVANICETAASTLPNSIEEFAAAKCKHDASKTVEEYRASLVLSLGENIQIKRLHIFHKDANHSVGIYSHMGGKIVSVVEIEGSNKADGIAREISMHIAAEAPEYLTETEIPKDIIAKEEEIARSQMEGKPANVIDKIIQGKLKSFYDQNCLLRQKFVKDPNMTIQQYVDSEAKKMGTTLAVKQFTRWQIGESA